MISFVDTHTHLFAKEFDEDIDLVIENAQKEGVNTLLLPNIDVASIPRLQRLMNAYPDVCHGMMGLHPGSVKEDYQQQLTIVEETLDAGTYVAVGEIGLDYYWDTTFVKEQKDAFRKQLIWAKERNLPVAIHTRSSFEDALEIVREEQDGNLRGVFHCFGGTLEEGRQIIDVGFYLGIGGTSTFKKSNASDVLPQLGLNRIILETDSPYLAPVPKRGKRNESAYVRFIAENMATIYETSLSEIAEITSRNAAQLFRL